MPKAQKAKLDEMVRVAHEHGRQIRFYALPQDVNVWKTLLEAGVDWINVDKLEMFANFYKDYLRTHRKSANCHCVRM